MHTPRTATADAVESRLASLETALTEERRRRRRLERVTGLAVLAAVAFGTLAAARPGSIVDVVQTRRLEVLDDGDRVVLVATAARHGGRIDLWDDAQVNVARLGANGIGGDLSLFDRRGRRSLSAFSDTDAGRIEVGGPDGGPAVLLTADDRGGRVAAIDSDGRALARLEGRDDHGVVAVGVAGRDVVELAAGDAGGRVLVRPEVGEGGIDLRGAGTLDLSVGPRRILGLSADADGGRVELCDPDGRPRIDLTASGSGGLLEARDRRGNALVALGVGASGSGMRVRNAEGIAAAAVGVDADGRGAIEIAAADGTRVAGLGVGTTGGRLTLAGLDGRSFLEAGGDGDGGRLEIRDAEERTVATMAGAGNGGRIAVGLEPARVGITLDVAGTGTPTISVIGPGGRTVAIAATPTGGLVNLFAADGVLSVAAGAATDGPGGVVSIRNERGTEVIRAGTTSDDRGLIAVSDATGGRTRRLSP